MSAMTLCSLMLAAVMTWPVQAGSGEDASKNVIMADEHVKQGADLYASSCAFCHGPTAKGGSSGPSLIDSSLVRHDKDGDQIGAVLRTGRMDKGMPSFPVFDKGQVADLVAFLHARITVSDSVETAGPAGGYELKHLLTGDAAAGKVFFDGKGGCVKCHSAKGDLAGIAKKYKPTELEANFLYPKADLKKVVVTLADGKTFEGKLVHLDAFYVAMTDHSGAYHSWMLSTVKVHVEDPLQQHTELLNEYTNKDMHDVFAYLETLQ